MSYFLPLRCHLFQPSNITIPNVLVNKNTKGKTWIKPHTVHQTIKAAQSVLPLEIQIHKPTSAI